jgi:hypothetical protein
MNYFSQNIFNGFATLITGLVAWFVYLYGKRDRKIEIATILLNEIFVAEREINNIKKNKIISDYVSVLPSNHWEINQHIFVKNFDVDELSKISEFYKSCSLAEDSLKSIRSYLPVSMDQKTRSIQGKLLELMTDSASNIEYEEKKKKILDLFHTEDYWFLPNAPTQKLIEYIQNIEQLSISSIGMKFKKVRDSKWYKIII